MLIYISYKTLSIEIYEIHLQMQIWNKSGKKMKFKYIMDFYIGFVFARKLSFLPEHNIISLSGNESFMMVWYLRGKKNNSPSKWEIQTYNY